MGPSPPTEDPWVGVETTHGFAADELTSALQKAIRRGELENALTVAYEMYSFSAALEEHLWRRLEVISVEDVGFGRIDAPVVVETLYRMHLRVPRPRGDRFLFAAHAVRLLATSVKDRTSDELANWAALSVERGERLPEVPDVALDMHTRRGRELGRGLSHFLREGALVANELPGRELTYREWLLKRAEGAAEEA
jgi:replication-associated recombination protein RarA